MKIYRKVIPKIAKDIIRSLLANRAIEVEDGHRDDAEVDVAGVLVGYLNDIDTVCQEAQRIMERKGYTPDLLGRVKRQIAKTNKLVMGEGSEEFVITRIIDGIFNSEHIEEVFTEDDELREMVQRAMSKYIGVDEELDREIRGRLKNLREGTADWEFEYDRLIEKMRARTAQQTP
ncbi:DUF507 family protein [Myxococcota bacterium]|nr:DUF507 family protein [Myxococcota bacterium]